MKTFLLIDYKGKFTVIQDEAYVLDEVVGKITKAQAMKEAARRILDSEYYGVPAYVGDDIELNKIFKEPVNKD